MKTSWLGEVPKLLTIQGRDGPIGLSKGGALAVLPRQPFGFTNDEVRITRMRDTARIIKELVTADGTCRDDKQQRQKPDKFLLTTFFGHGVRLYDHSEAGIADHVWALGEPLAPRPCASLSISL